MKTAITLLVAFTATLCSIGSVAQTHHVVPSTTKVNPATHSITAPLANTAQTYQMLIHADELSDLVNKELTGLSWRLAASESLPWPTSTITFDNYEIYIGQAVDLSQKTLTDLNDNLLGSFTQVRSGSLTIPVDAYGSGSSISFGPTIDFNTPYLYSGGNLLIEIRHTGSNGPSGNVEATHTGHSAYGTLYTASTAINNDNSHSNFASLQLSFSTPLAIQLVSFDALLAGNDVVIDWSAYSNDYLDYFVVEKSEDASMFFSIATEQANVSADTPMHYNYTDKSIARPLNGNYLYYRIKMVSNNMVTYSPVRAVQVTSASVFQFNVTLSPNPSQTSTELHITLSQNGQVTYSIFDMNGRVINTYNLDLEEGRNQVPIDVSRLPKGQYYIEVKHNLETKTIKFIK